MMMSVQCPPGASAGSTVRIADPSGQQLDVVIPSGITAGMSFQVQGQAAAPPPAKLGLMPSAQAAQSRPGRAVMWLEGFDHHNDRSRLSGGSIHSSGQCDLSRKAGENHLRVPETADPPTELLGALDRVVFAQAVERLNAGGPPARPHAPKVTAALGCCRKQQPQPQPQPQLDIRC